MKAFVLKEVGQQGWGEFDDVQLPELDPNKIRVKVKAVSINPVDYKISKGDKFKVNTPKILGCDFAGDVYQIGDNVSMFSPGQRVAGLASLLGQGSFAEYVDVDPLVLFIIPDGVTYKEAAVVPCAGVTAWQAIMEKVIVPNDSFIFITAGGGGVGGFAIQFATKCGAKPITTASSENKRIYDLGAEHIINYKTEDIAERVNEITLGEGVKTVIDMVSSNSAKENAKLLAYNGSIVTIQGQLSEAPFPPFTKAITIAEVALGAALMVGDKASMKCFSEAGSKILHMIKNKEIDPMITMEFKFEDIQKAFDQISSRTTKGKIVIEL